MLKIIIPARSGSKRVKDKNIRQVIDGKRTVDIVIGACRLAFPFSQIIISTDYPEVTFKKYLNNEMIKIHKRSDLNASDSATLVDVAKEVIQDHISSSYLLIFPTSILVTPKLLQLAHQVYKTNKKSK